MPCQLHRYHAWNTKLIGKKEALVPLEVVDVDFVLSMHAVHVDWNIRRMLAKSRGNLAGGDSTIAGRSKTVLTCAARSR